MDSFDLADLIPESMVNSLQEVLQEFLFFFLDSFFNSYSMCDNLILKTEDFVAYFLPHFEKGKKREWESYFKYYWPIRHGLQNYENQQNILLSILRDVVVRRREKSIDRFLDKTESKTTRRFVQTNVWNTPCVRDWTFRCKGSALDMSENQFDGVIRPLLLKKKNTHTHTTPPAFCARDHYVRHVFPAFFQNDKTRKLHADMIVCLLSTSTSFWI